MEAVNSLRGAATLPAQVADAACTLQRLAMKTLGYGRSGLWPETPMGEDRNEWLAGNTVEFFNEIRLLYWSIAEYCTPYSCPRMSAGPKFEYLWVDGNNMPQHLPAADYIENLMQWVEMQLEDESLFPTSTSTPFSPLFLHTVKVILKRLFRVYAHMYHSHFKVIAAMGLECHVNSSFKHFLFFIEHFGLVGKEELAPLEKLVQQFRVRRRN